MNNQRELRIAQLNKLLELTPHDAFLRYALALEMVNAGELATAEHMFLSLLKDNPEYTATYYHLAKLYETQENIEQAKIIYRQGIEITQKVRDMHALAELRSALNELEFED